MTDDLTTWLRDQIDADYETARLVIGVNAMAGVINGEPPPRWIRPPGTAGIYDTNRVPIVRHTWDREAAHIIRWDPARALAELDAKRRILGIHAKGDFPYDPDDGPGGYSWTERCDGCQEITPCQSVRLLALPYADRPGYREDWRP